MMAKQKLSEIMRNHEQNHAASGKWVDLVREREARIELGKELRALEVKVRRLDAAAGGHMSLIALLLICTAIGLGGLLLVNIDHDARLAALEQTIEAEEESP